MQSVHIKNEDAVSETVKKMEQVELDDNTSSKAELMRQRLAANEEARLAEVAKRYGTPTDDGRLTRP